MNCTLVFLHFTYTVLTANEVLIRTFVSRHAHKKQACTHGRAFCINISGGFTFLKRGLKQPNTRGARSLICHQDKSMPPRVEETLFSSIPPATPWVVLWNYRDTRTQSDLVRKAGKSQDTVENNWRKT